MVLARLQTLVSPASEARAASLSHTGRVWSSQEVELRAEQTARGAAGQGERQHPGNTHLLEIDSLRPGAVLGVWNVFPEQFLHSEILGKFWSWYCSHLSRTAAIRLCYVRKGICAISFIHNATTMKQSFWVLHMAKI